MAPVSVVCRRSRGEIHSLFVLFCFISYFIQYALSSFVYDKLALLSLQPSANELLSQARYGSYHSPPFLKSIPGYLRRWPSSLPARRRRKRRGCRGGLAVKLKHFLQQQRESRSFQALHHGKGLAGDFFIRSRSLDPVQNWNIPLTLAVDAVLPVYGSP